MVARRRERSVLRDFCEVAAYCRQMAPDIRPIPLLDGPSSQLRHSIFIRPTLIFALRRLLFYHPLRGVVRSSKLLPKSEEYRRMQAIGIPVPRWRLLTRRLSPEVADLGRYVVSKPDFGGLGADVRIRRAGRVRWAPADTPVRFASRSGVIAQEFIYTGPWPISYRVGTLFGRALYSQRAEGSHERRPILGPESFTTSSVTATHQGCSFTLDNDRESYRSRRARACGIPRYRIPGRRHSARNTERPAVRYRSRLCWCRLALLVQARKSYPGLAGIE